MNFNNFMGKYSKGSIQEKNKLRSKRINYPYGEFCNIMNEYNSVIKSLERKVDDASQNVRFEISQKYNGPYNKGFKGLSTKHEKMCEFAKAGMFNFDELKGLLSSGDFLFSNEDIQTLMQINHIQRERFYVYCSLASDHSFNYLEKETCDKYDSVCSSIDSFKDRSFKTNIESIIRGDLIDSSSNKEGPTLYDKFKGGMDYASKHMLIGVECNPSANTVRGYSYDSQQAFASSFISDYIKKNRNKIIPLRDVESLNKISDYMKKQVKNITCMSDEDFLEHKINQMHLTDEEREKFNYKVSQFIESERVYSGRSI